MGTKCCRAMRKCFGCVWRCCAVQISCDYILPKASLMMPSIPGFAALRAPHPFPLAAWALANYLKLTALRPLGFSRTSPYRSKLLTALHEKSPGLCAELQIVCGEGGIRTPGAFQLNSFQDCRNRPLYHLSKVLGLFSEQDCKYRHFIRICNG